MKTRTSILIALLFGAQMSFAQGADTAVALPRELIWIIYFITFLMLVLALFLWKVSVDLK